MRFASTNECDYLIFNKSDHNLYALELKTTESSSLTFWREDFEDKKKKQTFMIRKNQILGLQEMAKFDIVAGFIINFRNDNNDTFFIHIDDFLSVTNNLDKKSINIKDVLDSRIYTRLNSNKLKTNYRYDVAEMLRNIRLY